MTTEMLSFSSEEGSDAGDEDKGLPWASREVLAGAGFSEKSDVYSFGIVLWEIMQADGSLPYAGLVPGQVSNIIFLPGDKLSSMLVSRLLVTERSGRELAPRACHYQNSK